MIWDFDPVIGCVKDWRNKYSDTIVLLEGRPAYIADVSEETTNLLLHPHKELMVLNHDESYDLAQFLPPSQWVSLAGFISFLQRVPNRQWHRSLHRNCYTVRFPYDQRASLRDRLVGRLDYAAAIVDQTETSLREAAGILLNDSSRYGVVLNQQFAVLLYSEDTMQLCGPAGIVGFVNPTTQTVLVCSHIFQEVVDLLRGEPEWRIIKSTSI